LATEASQDNDLALMRRIDELFTAPLSRLAPDGDSRARAEA
jgi:hypothetical protein